MTPQRLPLTPPHGKRLNSMDDGRPLAIDLFCGLGGWTEGFIAEGYRVVGFDNDSRFAKVYPGVARGFL